MKTIEDFFKDSEEIGKRIERRKACCAGYKLCQLQENGQEQKGRLLLDRVLKVRFKEGVE